MKKVLGILIMVNQAKSDVIELTKCFEMKHSAWENPTKFHNVYYMYEFLTNTPNKRI